MLIRKKLTVQLRSMKTREKLYNTLVRPHLEYAPSVWDPHVTKKKQAIEKVQRRAARWVTNQHDSMSSVTAMLKELDWQPLELRRVHSRLCLLYIPNYKWYCGHATRSLSPSPQSCFAFVTTCAHTATCDIPMQDKLF